MVASTAIQNKQNFCQGAGYIFGSWTALQLAVSNGWGGKNSSDKYSWFIQQTIDLFSKSKYALILF